MLYGQILYTGSEKAQAGAWMSKMNTRALEFATEYTPSENEAALMSVLFWYTLATNA